MRSELYIGVRAAMGCAAFGSVFLIFWAARTGVERWGLRFFLVAAAAILITAVILDRRDGRY